jgi:hypothetical protein
LVVGIALLSILCCFWRNSIAYTAGIQALQAYEASLPNADVINQYPCSSMFLWHKCLFSATHFHPDADQRDDSSSLDVDLLLAAFDNHHNHHKPFRMYIQTTQLPTFFKLAWPVLVRKDASFVLVTGCSDVSLQPTSEVLAVMNHPKLLRWFAQNVDLKHDKLVALPIGIDFHTLVWHRYYWHTYRIMPEPQNTQVANLAEHACNHPEQRRLAILVNFKVRGHDERSKAVASMQRNLPEHMIVYPGAEPRLAVWQQATGVEFVLSPPGVGKDCHRTWESLAVGAIPIVLRDAPFAQVYKGYPVVMVDSWDEITPSALAQWQQTLRPRMQAMLTNPDRMLSRSFIHEIMAVSPGDLPRAEGAVV